MTAATSAAPADAAVASPAGPATTGTPAGPAGGSGSRRSHLQFHPLRVAAVDRLTADAVAITFEVPPELAEEYRFTQGQHLNLRCVLDGQEVRRSYSICAPASSRQLRVAVKRLEGGAFSAYAIDAMRPGDVMDVMPPAGRFFVPLDPQRTREEARHFAAVAAGSGITPILSIIATTLEEEPHSRVTLIYGNRTTRSILFLEELQDLKDRYPDRLQLVHVLSREAQEAALLSGRIDRERLALLLQTLVPTDTVDHWFLCGPFLLVEEARQALRDAGVPAAHIHAELFHVASEPPRTTKLTQPSGAGRGGMPDVADGADGAAVGGGASVTVVLDGRETSFALRPGEGSVLDGTLRVRADAPYACKGGVCGTCRAKLVTGEVRMDRNYALEPDEIEAGFVLACQSHPVTDEVKLDFDV